MDHGDGDDQVEDLLKGEVLADLVSALGGGEKRTACGDDAGTVVVEQGVAAIRVLEELGGDVALAGGKGEEPAQPGGENRPWRLAAGGFRGRTDGVDLGDEHSLELLAELAAGHKHATTEKG